MKITQYVLAIGIGFWFIASGCSAETTDEAPALRGALTPAPLTDTAPVIEGEEAGPGQNSKVTPSGNSSSLSKECQSAAKTESANTDATQTQATKALQGNVTKVEVNTPEDGTSLSGQTSKEIAAIGISWNLFNHVINYVDPGSDLFGKVEPGKDRFLGLGSLDAIDVVRSGYNIGDSGTWVEAVIRGRDRITRHIPVRRQPLSNFAPKFARSLARQYRLSHR